MEDVDTDVNVRLAKTEKCGGMQACQQFFIHSGWEFVLKLYKMIIHTSIFNRASIKDAARNIQSD